ncbi:MAG: Rne/Rng family ribonuclease [Phycisphaeraceae bacterium]|nr:Rne/Rng family ribonuclease [Phycisphaeraceae bacterium]
MPKTQMLINYAPGEECRVAIIEDGKLEEYHAESVDSASHVNSIYVGRVRSVEPAIQAAFVDFGLSDNGFLHVSDLHPMYFPGEDEETTERVGKKTPRRERPPIQACLKRGQEVIVQVLKEGVGTKGPTLTSYLSIPGRYLVMMPNMDRVGVSRKVEDEELRKKMRDALAQLELPDGFGFILRTAGLERTKLELKRDLAYLMRLWKDMEKRQAQGNKPRLLYSESDLLVRALRDLLTSDIQEVVIDHPHALARAAAFLKIVAPRGGAKLLRYAGSEPMFHAFGVESQILTMHSPEVHLASGARLVIDEAEALVAIDVNSGKVRDTKDTESTALKVNLDAVDEICRQLRLRDLGGLVILDLIDMHASSNRKKVEQRIRERLKRDRARTTVLPISAFGIVEMTRQRMRGSHERVHFAPCPTCHGRGLVQKPGSVVADALREMAALLAHDRVHRVEMVVAPRLAGELLSSRRQSLSHIESTIGKHADVRVSEAIPIDRVVFYAYDETGSDLKIDSLRTRRAQPQLDAWADDSPVEDWAFDDEEIEAEVERDAETTEDATVKEDAAEASPGPKKKRRRRRRRKAGAEGAAENAPDGAAAEEDSSAEPAEESGGADDLDSGADVPSRADAEEEAPSTGGTQKKRRRRRRRKSATETTGTGEKEPSAASEPELESGAKSDAKPTAKSDGAEGGTDAKRKRRRRRGGRGRSGEEPKSGEREVKPSAEPARPTPTATQNGASTPAAKSDSGAPKPRVLYAARRKLAPGERRQRTDDR